MINDPKWRLAQLRKDSPDTYAQHISKRIPEIEDRLMVLRGKYPSATPEEKTRITSEADELKEELTLYE